MSSNDFSGPRRKGYAPPEGWGDDGFWRDSAVDADYETGAHPAVNGRGASRSNGQATARGAGRPAPGGPANGAMNGARGGGGAAANGATGRHAMPSGPAGPGATSADATTVRPGSGRYAGPWQRGGRQYGGFMRRGAGDPTRVDRVPPGMRPGGPGRGPGGPGGPRRPGYGPRGPVSRSWWRTWTWKKALAVAGASFGGLVVLLALAGYFVYHSTSIPSEALASAVSQNSTVTFSDGKTVVGTYGSTHRQLLTYNQIPKTVQDSVLAAEERSFFSDGAISPTGIMRAAYDDITSSGGNLSGGSTITQEFVRQYYQDIGTQQTASRKIKEIFVAEKLSKEKSKQWILTNYLNTIYLGDDAYGVAAAAKTYFGEPVSKLSYAQAAVIAAIIQQPSNYPQPQFRPQLEARWHYVLSGLVKMGDITAQQAATMKFPDINPDGSQFTGKDPWDAYIMQEVKGELENDGYTEHQLDTGGLKITLTVSDHAERELYKAVNENISAIKASGFTLPSYALVGAEAENPANGNIDAVYPGPGMNLPKKECGQTCQLNTTLTAEQVGSSFKPYVLSAAVQQGMNVQTSILNANPTLWVPPFSMGTTPSSTKQMPAPYYKVNNDNHESIPGALSNGGSTVQNALAQSSNTAFTDLAHRVGLKPIEQMSESMGGVDPKTYAFSPGVGIALGINSLTVNDQASMVSTIDNGGVYHQAHMIASIKEPGGAVKHPTVPTHVALPQSQTSQVQYAMLKTVTDGTATAANMDDGRPIIGKTGTTTGSKSAFFIGGIPQDVLAVGIFTKDQGDKNNPETLEALGGGGFGGTWPARIWHSYAESMWSGLPIQNFLNPQFTGEAWLQLPKPKPKPKPKPTQNNNHNKHHGGFPLPTTGPGGIPTTQPNPTPTCAGLFGCPSTSPAPTSSPTSSSPPGRKVPGG